MAALFTTSLTLAPQSETEAHMSGHIIPKSGDELVSIGKFISQLLAGQNQTLNVQGIFVQPSNTTAAVSWLSNAFNTLKFQVYLPGQGHQVRCSVSKMIL
jgi:hypothetical protein